MRAVVELDPAAQLEGVGHAVGRDRPALRQIGHHLGVVLAAEFHQQGVMGRDRVDQGKRRAAVAVVVRRLGDHAEVEGTPTLGRLRADWIDAKSQHAPYNGAITKGVSHHSLAPS